MIRTERLILRRWDTSDFEFMAAINADLDIMKYFPSVQDEEQTRQLIEKIEQHFKKYGFGLYAVEPLNFKQCIGFVGLNYTDFKAHFTPACEIGWRLSKEHWGKGYATEAGKEVLKKAFLDFNLDNIVSFTSKINMPSIKVMERLGLKRDLKDDFINPKLPHNHILAPHVLYRLSKAEYINRVTHSHY